ncbi:MAG: ATP-grasp domain-containing protein [Candidatus Pacebacteria bacterium]|nr:ATP-grasp domain-containing protein [Candidatus Paceibacterota bacterium]
MGERYGIKQPKTLHTKDYKYSIIKGCLGSNFVIKPDNGSKGRGVALVDSEESFNDYFNSRDRNEDCIFQELIDNSQEYRVYAAGSKAVATYKKSPGENDFRANLHTGGTITATEPEKEAMLLKFGSMVASKFKVDISGIDILVKKDTCYLLEINQQPGWNQLEELTGVDFPAETARFILSKIK